MRGKTPNDSQSAGICCGCHAASPLIGRSCTILGLRPIDGEIVGMWPDQRGAAGCIVLTPDGRLQGVSVLSIRLHGMNGASEGAVGAGGPEVGKVTKKPPMPATSKAAATALTAGLDSEDGFSPDDLPELAFPDGWEAQK